MKHFSLGLLNDNSTFLIKEHVEMLINSITLSAPLNHLIFSSFYQSNRYGFQGCISRLSNFKDHLLHIELKGICFDLNELIKVSRACVLKSVRLERYIPLSGHPIFTPEMFTRSSSQILNNVKDSVEILQFEYNVSKTREPKCWIFKQILTISIQLFCQFLIRNH